MADTRVADPDSVEGRQMAALRVREQLLNNPQAVALPGKTMEESCNAVTHMFPLCGTTVKNLAKELSGQTSMSEDEFIAAILNKMRNDPNLLEGTHYIGEIQVYSKGDKKGQVKLKGPNMKLKITIDGIVVIPALIFEGTPVFGPYMALLGIGVRLMSTVVDEMRSSWAALQGPRDKRARESKANTQAFAEIGGISEVDANILLMRHVADAYKDLYFAGNNAKTAMAKVGLKKKKNTKVYEELSEHGNLMEAARMSMLKVSAKARRAEVEAETTPEGKRRKMHEIVNDQSDALKANDFGKIFRATEKQQIDAYLRRSELSTSGASSSSSHLLEAEEGN
mmetsp:Transcript_98303/g.281260  ORF Transcript_98303/g.281260 Transcript_98303/m.281260 type:complete len:338 (+) Transcript_98303:172-1185(+)|eukprot:CAMPEP_0119542748 /NCGR_PEP_ID=MMETSP1344-20130328/53759_1 /TAXON_ID=236787 /ORGANISM="Florenciella parvula, Strain CCMP2471" /LENGTH=337 /DNA_ID=CAMNT_0007587003 /DNA_START=148 /DNA_END=1161 /DNA_ORIENTATION=-